MDEICKYCQNALMDLTAEGLQCQKCQQYVHINCLKRGSTPGGLLGDVFYDFTCSECNDFTGEESFTRGHITWLDIIILAFYNVTEQNKGISCKGFFHWKSHVGAFINRNWNCLFGKGVQQKKTWVSTIAGKLSKNSPHIFISGSKTVGEPGWWALRFPKLTPYAINKINLELQERRSKSIEKSDLELVMEIIEKKNYSSDFTMDFYHLCLISSSAQENELDADYTPLCETEIKPKRNGNSSFGQSDVKRQKISEKPFSADENESSSSTDTPYTTEGSTGKPEADNFLDPMSHYNTSLSNYTTAKFLNLQTKLLGGLREDTFLSPYSNLYLKPYIYRESRRRSPLWLKLMTQILLRTHTSDTNYVLPPRSTIDYMYVQPSHIPAINSLCHQFFWPGIDLSESLQYPDFTCVVLYKRLIIGFAFVVPDVQHHENYISFIFVRPEWRNIGIGKFMVYHLIQTSMGKDLTLHVAINNPALFLYQKFGFKLERVELNFYDKYLPGDSKMTKHAFFCRLER